MADAHGRRTVLAPECDEDQVAGAQLVQSGGGHCWQQVPRGVAGVAGDLPDVAGGVETKGKVVDKRGQVAAIDTCAAAAAACSMQCRTFAVRLLRLALTGDQGDSTRMLYRQVTCLNLAYADSSWWL